MARSLALLLVLAAACDTKPKPAQISAPPPAPTTSDGGAPVLDGSPSDDAAVPAPAPGTAALPAATVVKPLADASNALGLELWARVRATPGNLALSPTSISLALAMTWAGAKGNTADQMSKVLHVTGAPLDVATAWGQIAAALQSADRPLTLAIANRLFAEQTITIQAPYLALTRDAFAAPLERTSFIGDAEGSRTHINTWVAEVTHQRIRDLLPPRSITDHTRLVLVNAIYFLAEWATPFEREATYPIPFTPAGAPAKPVPMMSAHYDAAYAHVDGVQLLALPYRGNTARMLFVLPDGPDGLPAVEAKLTPAMLATWRTALKPTDLAIHLPRFEIQPTAPLVLGKELQALGMTDPFTTNADFTAIANPPRPEDRLHIDEVFHKAFVKVDEKGTEAAAATAVVMADGTGAPRPPAVTFTADHPFLFFLIDDSTNLVLFMGRVADPAQ